LEAQFGEALKEVQELKRDDFRLNRFGIPKSADI
jgi:hypothetical protein